MADAWVINASSLIALAHADKLELLENLPARLVIPEAVAEEILAGPDDPARRALASGWGPRHVATVPEKVSEWGLGKGGKAPYWRWPSSSTRRLRWMTAVLAAAPRRWVFPW